MDEGKVCIVTHCLQRWGDVMSVHCLQRWGDLMSVHCLQRWGDVMMYMYTAYRGGEMYVSLSTEMGRCDVLHCLQRWGDVMMSRCLYTVYRGVEM